MRHTATITAVVRESSDVTTLHFTVDNRVLKYTAGQYICAYFSIPGQPEGKAYSLSSAPHEPTMAITVKQIGAFSERLCALCVGDTLDISRPFGFFNTQDALPIVAIAAGVGVAPVWSIVKDVCVNEDARSLSLHVSARVQEGLVFRSQVQTLFAKSPQRQAHWYVTQGPPGSTIGRRFSVSRDIGTEVAAQARFYVCGSEAFVRSIWRQLMAAGVDEMRVVTETFFEAPIGSLA